MATPPPHCSPYAPCLSARAPEYRASLPLPFPANLIYPVDISTPCAKGLRLLRGSSAHHHLQQNDRSRAARAQIAARSLARLAADKTDPPAHTNNEGPVRGGKLAF